MLHILTRLFNPRGTPKMREQAQVIDGVISDLQDIAKISREKVLGDLTAEQLLEHGTLHRVFEMGKVRGREDARRELQEADVYRQNVEASVTIALTCIDQGQIAEARSLINSIMDVPDPEVRADVQQALDEMAFSPDRPRFERTRKDGARHLYSDPGDMARDALKEMTPEQRIEALRDAGVDCDSPELPRSNELAAPPMLRPKVMLSAGPVPHFEPFARVVPPAADGSAACSGE